MNSWRPWHLIFFFFQSCSLFLAQSTAVTGFSSQHLCTFPPPRPQIPQGPTAFGSRWVQLAAAVVRASSSFCGYRCLDSVWAEQSEQSVHTTVIHPPERCPRSAERGTVSGRKRSAICTWCVRACTGPGLTWYRQY